MRFVYVEGDMGRDSEVGDRVSGCWIGAGAEDGDCVLLDGEAQVVERVFDFGFLR